MNKIYVVGEATYYASPIDNVVLTDNLEEAQIVLFTGGEDVCPSYYGEKKHPTTFCNPARDAEEAAIFKQVRPDQLCIGICRGSQFLCVMNGGKLVQNCFKHAIWGTHLIYNDEGDKMEITSTHHQMQMPYLLDPKDYDVLYYAKNRSKIYEGGENDYNDIINNQFKGKEPEIVLYHKEGMPKCLAIQGHPEMMIRNCKTIETINKLINSLL